MSYRHPTPNPNRSPQSKKENLDDPPVDKRRRIGAGGMVGPAGNPRARQVLSVVNAAPGDAPAAATAEGADGAGFELTSREDVDRLLNEKMKGKNKTDYKGKSEQMIEYIRKLRICIKWLMEREDADLTELDKLRASLDSEEKRHAEIEAQMRSNADELNATIEELRRRTTSLEESCRKEETDKMAAMKLYEEEKLVRNAAECSRDSLSVDLHNAGIEASRLNDQIKTLQETNKRLQEYNTSLQQYNSTLQAEAAKNGERISKLDREKITMVESLNTLREMQKSLTSKLEISKTSLQEAINRKEELKKEVGSLGNELQQVRGDRDRQVVQVQSLLADIANYKELTGKSAEYLDEALTKTNALEATCSSQSEEIKTLQHQLAAANEKLKSADVTSVGAMTKFEEQKKTVEQLQARVADSENQLIEAEKLRKKLHNTILELKGNIRVFCRVRPILTDGDVSGSEMAVSFPKSTELSGRGIELNHNAQKYSFSFDKVFTYEDSQEDVFVEISQLVQSALDGYKVCIFAYGQTGSGKTYTMMGRPEAPDQKGVIPRSLEQIFQTSQSLLSQGWKFKMQASMLEIYNETIRDLLSTNRQAGDTKQYGIKHDANGNTYVSDLTVVDVSSIKEVSFLLKQAAQSRSVGKTQMNEQSSRSHFVFTLRIFGFNEITEQQVQGVLNLIDLAGSERLAKSGATGDRLKETQAINKSLSTLSDVIFAIAKKEDHIPFRNSKLTYLLQPCLGGDSKTLMFVNISPEQSSTGESKSSLLFAARVNSCEIGIPRRQTQTQMRSSDLQLSNG